MKEIESLSARRAWIEICRNRFCPTCQWVALRKESVDRNDNYNLHCVEEVSSLSARRAWIEIIMRIGIVTGCVSLSARRAWIEIYVCV